MIRTGYSYKEICDKLKNEIHKVNSCVIINNLNNLINSGRIGRKMASFASMLGIKPVLGMLDGELTVVSKVIGNNGSLKYITDFIINKANKDTSICLIHHGDSLLFDQVRDFLEYNKYNYSISKTGCVVGAYVGRGCVGVFFK